MQDIYKTIEMRLIEVNKDNEEEIFIKLYKPKCIATDPKFKVGD